MIYRNDNIEITNELEEMETEKLQELKMDKLYCLNGIIKMCREMGNKDWENNVMVKAYRDKIIEIDKILNEREHRKQFVIERGDED